MLHPREFLIFRSMLPAGSGTVLQRRHGATVALTVLFANYCDRSEAVAYATAVYPGDGSVLIEPPLDVLNEFRGDRKTIIRGLTGFAALGAALVDGVDPGKIYRAPGLGSLDQPDAYLDGLFVDLPGAEKNTLPALLAAYAKLDLSDADMPRLRPPTMTMLKDGYAVMTLAKMACELLEKTTIWHVAEAGDDDDYKAVRLAVDHPLGRDSTARRDLYRVAARSHTYVRTMVHATRFASR